MSWFSAIGGALGSIGGSILSSNAASSGKKKIKRARDRSITEQNDQYAQTRADYQPYMQLGQQGVNALSDPAANFQSSPGYDFARQEGTRDFGNVASLKGGGGNAMKALTEFQTGLAQQDYGNWWNRQQGLVNTGAQATGNVGQFGAAKANSIQNANTGAAAQMSGIGQWNAENQNAMLQGGISNSLYAWKNRKQ